MGRSRTRHRARAAHGPRPVSQPVRVARGAAQPAAPPAPCFRGRGTGESRGQHRQSRPPHAPRTLLRTDRSNAARARDAAALRHRAGETRDVGVPADSDRTGHEVFRGRTNPVALGPRSFGLEPLHRASRGTPRIPRFQTSSRARLDGGQPPAGAARDQVGETEGVGHRLRSVARLPPGRSDSPHRLEGDAQARPADQPIVSRRPRSNRHVPSGLRAPDARGRHPIGHRLDPFRSIARRLDAAGLRRPEQGRRRRRDDLRHTGRRRQTLRATQGPPGAQRAHGGARGRSSRRRPSPITRRRLPTSSSGSANGAW